MSKRETERENNSQAQVSSLQEKSDLTAGALGLEGEAGLNVIIIGKKKRRQWTFNAQMQEKVIFYYSKKAFKNYRKKQENVSAMDGTKTQFNRVIIHLGLMCPVIHTLKCAALSPHSILRKYTFDKKALCCYYCGVSKRSKSKKLALQISFLMSHSID